MEKFIDIEFIRTVSHLILLWKHVVTYIFGNNESFGFSTLQVSNITIISYHLMLQVWYNIKSWINCFI